MHAARTIESRLLESPMIGVYKIVATAVFDCGKLKCLFVLANCKQTCHFTFPQSEAFHRAEPMKRTRDAPTPQRRIAP